MASALQTKHCHYSRLANANNPNLSPKTLPFLPQILQSAARMPNNSKRKAAPEVIQDGRAGKRSKGGSGGRWQTPHQRAKATAIHHRSGGGKIESGDAGIWATCIKGKEGAATEELKGLFEEYSNNLYGLIDGDAETTIEQEVEADIESSIQKEISSINVKEGPAKLFTSVYLDLQCVLFFKTRHPVIPVDFVRRICKDASDNVAKRKLKYVNRLTPVTKVARANEKGLEELGKEVLGKHFQLACTGADDSQATGDTPASVSTNYHLRAVGKLAFNALLQLGSIEVRRMDDEDLLFLVTHKQEFPMLSPQQYAIRPTIRNHNTLKRDTVINLIASLIGSAHKVDLTKPEKVILVEIYQTTCGMSIVEADWESMKRYNLAEIYERNLKPSANSGVKKEVGATPGRVSRDES